MVSTPECGAFIRIRYKKCIQNIQSFTAKHECLKIKLLTLILILF